MIKLNNKYDNGKYILYKLDTSKRDANLTKITESYDFENNDISYYGRFLLHLYR